MLYKEPIKIGVFCSGNSRVSNHFKRIAHDLGLNIAKLEYSLVLGGKESGLMHEVLTGYTSASSIKPIIFPEHGDFATILNNRLIEFRETCKAVVVLPGGFGTLHELIDCLVYNQSKIFSKPIILLNIDNFWDPLLLQFKKMLDNNMLQKDDLGQLQVAKSLEDCMKLLELYIADLIT